MRILIVEDDEKLSKIMKRQLTETGYEADVCNDGGDIWYYLNQGVQVQSPDCVDDMTRNSSVYDLLILDRMLPTVDGLTILASLRKSGCRIPVIMVTALGTLDNRIEGLDCGADDYLVKPFAMEELHARIRALLRRPPELTQPELLTYSDLSFNLATQTLSSPEASCELSKKERELMEYFMKHPEQTIVRDILFARVWGAESDVSDGNLDNYISFLRRRLRSLQSRVQIKTVHATGYRLEDSCHENEK